MKLAALVLVLANLACLPFGNGPLPRHPTHHKGLMPYRQQGTVLRVVDGPRRVPEVKEGRSDRVQETHGNPQNRQTNGSIN